MNTEITIRQANAADLDTIARLMALGFGDDEATRRQAMENNPRFNVRNVLLAEMGDEAVGTASALPNQMWMSGVPLQFGAVAAVTTHPDYRKQGISTALMQRLLENMSRDGVAVSALFPGDL